MITTAATAIATANATANATGNATAATAITTAATAIATANATANATGNAPSPAYAYVSIRQHTSASAVTSSRSRAYTARQCLNKDIWNTCAERGRQFEGGRSPSGVESALLFFGKHVSAY